MDLPSADEGFVLGECGLAVVEAWDMEDAGGALHAGEEGCGIREAGGAE